MFQVWQAKNAVFCTEAELGSLHRAAQTKFNRFETGLSARRLAEHCTVLHCTALYCIVLYCTALYCIVLYCTSLYCIVLYCIELYCTALYRFVAGLPARRLAEHRTNLARAQISSNMQIIEEAPGGIQGASIWTLVSVL